MPDVEAFPGLIACSSTTRSEGVVPGFVARWEQISRDLADPAEFLTIVAPKL